MCWQYKMRSSRTPDDPIGQLLPSERGVGQIFQSGIFSITDQSLPLYLFSTNVTCDFNESLNKDVGQNACISITFVMLEMFLSIFVKIFQSSKVHVVMFVRLSAQPSVFLDVETHYRGNW